MTETETGDAQIEELVDGLFVQDDSAHCFERLKTVGDRAIPFLVSALKDPRVPTTAFDPPIPPGLPNFASPFYRISNLLENSRSADAAAPFVELLSGPDPRFRQDAARSLGAIGLENCIEPVRRILTGDDQHLRTYAMMGIEVALSAGRAAPEFIRAIRPCLVDLLRVPARFGPCLAPKLLARIDAQRATPILLSPEHLSPENPTLQDVIAALNEAQSAIPHSLLLPLIAQLEPLADQYRRSQELSEALLAYARNPDAHTETRLRGLLKSPIEEVQTGAARALAALNGIEDFDGKLVEIELEDVRGVETLSAAERNYYTVSIYYYEIQNGGLWQYFGNSTADYHKMILAGLRAFGAPRSAQVLEDAGGVFGPDGPPEDRNARSEAVDSFSVHQAETIDSLEAVKQSNISLEFCIKVRKLDS
jgi:hypothetical protein